MSDYEGSPAIISRTACCIGPCDLASRCSPQSDPRQSRATAAASTGVAPRKGHPMEAAKHCRNSRAAGLSLFRWRMVMAEAASTQ
jgi:hypothetical protein